MKIPLLFIAILLIISCKKNDAPSIETEEEPLPIAKLKKVSVWYGFSDTSGLPNYTDTIYYNTNNQIERIQSINPYSSKPTLNYNITYNSVGKISFIASSAATTDTTFADYTFIYNADGKLDSLKSDLHFYPFYSYYALFKYNANGNLSDIYSYAPYQPGTFYMRSHSIYGWNASRKLDSLHIETFAREIPDSLINTRTFTFTSASNIMTSLDKTYLMTVALRQDPSFNFSSSSGYSSNLGELMVFHQFVNPGINMLGDGSEISDYYEGVYQHFNTPYYHLFDLYSDKQLRTLIPYFFRGDDQTVYPINVQRFEYLPAKNS